MEVGRGKEPGIGINCHRGLFCFSMKNTYSPPAQFRVGSETKDVNISTLECVRTDATRRCSALDLNERSYGREFDEYQCQKERAPDDL